MKAIATSLFELADGAEPPSDADLRAVDAKKEMAAKLKAVIAEVDTLFFKLKFLDADSKLAVARHLAGALNGTTRMFNVAVFIRDKEEHETGGLFDKPATVLAEMELV